MSDVTEFPRTKVGQSENLGRDFVRDMQLPSTRSFMGITFTDDGNVGSYFPDDLTLEDVLMAKAIIDRLARQLIDSQ